MLNSLLIAFRTYSRIPVPEAEWNEKNMRYAICFFPLIGAVIGALEWAWMYLAGALGCGDILYAAVAAVIPLLITGAIHMDGFCDTVDALSSHQSREKMLEILKDSHTGAFAVIFAGAWQIVYFACFTQMRSAQALWIAGFGFVLSRSLSGLALAVFRNARQGGMLYEFSRTIMKNPVVISMLGAAAVGICGMVLAGGWQGAAAAAANLLMFGYYRVMSYRKFGGITGDLEGWFLQMAELSTAVMTALLIRL